jgi:hypothetical protein
MDEIIARRLAARERTGPLGRDRPVGQ